MTTPVTYAFLDFEYATDPVLKDTHIIQVGCIIAQQNGKIQKRYKTLVNIDFEIDENTQQLTGIQHTDNGLPCETMLQTLHTNLLDCDTIFTFNAQDKRVYLDACQLYYMSPLLRDKIVDIIPMIQHVTGIKQVRSLETITQHLPLKKGTTHDALYDAYLLYQYMLRATKNFSDIEFKHVSRHDKVGHVRIEQIEHKAIVSITHQSNRFGYVGVKNVHIPLGQPTDIHAQRKMADAYTKGYAQLTKQPLVTSTYKDKLQLNHYMSLCKNKKYKKPKKRTYTYK